MFSGHKASGSHQVWRRGPDWSSELGRTECSRWPRHWDQPGVSTLQGNYYILKNQITVSYNIFIHTCIYMAILKT